MTAAEFGREQRRAARAVPAPTASDSLVARLPRVAPSGIAFALFILVAALVIVTFQDYGVTWDEDVHNWYGIFVLDYYRSGFHDLRALHWEDLINYGCVFDMSAAALNLISPFGTYETRHLLNGMVGVAGLIGVWKLGRQLGGERCGLIAALFLLLTPNYYGQMFNNPKDIPFAAGMVWAFYYMARITPALPRPRWSLVAKLGLAAGLTLGVRVGGFLLVGYLGLLLGAHSIWRTVEAHRQIAQTNRHEFTAAHMAAVVTFTREAWASFWRVLLPVVAIAYPVMLVFWPWAQWAPIAHPLSALATFSHQEFPFPTLFAGRYIEATQLPWDYLPVHILLALPELILLLLIALPIVAVIVLARRGRSLDRRRVLPLALVAFGILFPVAWAVGIKAVLFDGMRHFIFVLPLIAALTAVAADRALDRLRAPRVRAGIYAALALYGAGHVTEMAMLHRRGAGPFQARLLGQLLCGGGPGSRRLCARRIRRRLHGP